MTVTGKYHFWIDRGGTFTDFVVQLPGGNIETLKLLSESDEYPDAVVEGIQRVMKNDGGYNSTNISEIRMGTTVATNAYLEQKGLPTALVCTNGFKDILEIGYQNRQNLFDLNIKKQPLAYKMAIEIEERIDSEGRVVLPPNTEKIKQQLKQLKNQGIESLSVSLMHSSKNPLHELHVKELAESAGFSYVSLSHQVSSIGKIIRRGQTSVLDAYLSPGLLKFTNSLARQLDFKDILFMQSHGGLCSGSELKGHNALLSGPAGGYVAAAKLGKAYGFEKIISFDMGGTSTDVALFAGQNQIEQEPEFQGLPIQAPMLDIHTVAAGGGSVLFADGPRLRVGPDSAGANPGPACYRKGGPLTVTDANLLLGRIKAEDFPKIFGPKGNQPLDLQVVQEKFQAMARKQNMDALVLAENFLAVAVESMAGAIRQVSINKGYDPKEFVLICFGGAGAQLACRVAERLNIPKVMIHPLSSLLSAFGMGLTEEKHRETMAVNQSVSSLTKKVVDPLFESLKVKNIRKVISKQNLLHTRYYQLKPTKSDHFLEIKAETLEAALSGFQDEFIRLFGFSPDNTIELQGITLETSAVRTMTELKLNKSPAKLVDGFCVESEKHTFIVIDDGWQGQRTEDGLWILQKVKDKQRTLSPGAELEISYQRLQSIAEEMGTVLKNTGYSVNIKERLDYSCAIFTRNCELIANAPHMPVHLGSMSECVKFIHEKFCNQMSEGDSFISNSPLEGGTHLPDITVVTPVFINSELAFYLASRGHHADIGGTSPGSMPSDSKSLSEEGIEIKAQRLVSKGHFQSDIFESLSKSAKYPARNTQQNLHDLKAQLAANKRGLSAIKALVSELGLDHVEKNAYRLLKYTHHKLNEALKDFKSGSAKVELEDNRSIQVSISHSERLIIDFTGTSERSEANFNAPKPVTKAAVLYTLRCLLKENIPLNDGLAMGLDIIIPKDSLLDPAPNSAVVAGNVETSQAIVDALLEALGVLAHSAGTMSNLSFGSGDYQYYETIAGGSGAGNDFHGADAVQTHMTNSRLTDPEVLEKRFPIRLTEFRIRNESGGKGRFCGGNGIERSFLFLQDLECHLLSQRHLHAPKGIKGGEPAAPGEAKYISPDGEVKNLNSTFHIHAERGGCLSIKTPGGGGYGESTGLS